MLAYIMLNARLVGLRRHRSWPNSALGFTVAIKRNLIYSTKYSMFVWTDSCQVDLQRRPALDGFVFKANVGREQEANGLSWLFMG